MLCIFQNDFREPNLSRGHLIEFLPGNNSIKRFKNGKITSCVNIVRNTIRIEITIKAFSDTCVRSYRIIW